MFERDARLMATTTTVKVEGLRELSAAMRDLAQNVQNNIARSATNSAAQVVKKAAISKAPNLTGNLKKNIIVRRLPKAESALTSEHIVTVRRGRLTVKQKAAGITGAMYAGFVEFGTVKMPARPYLRPAFDQTKTQAVDAMAAQLKKRIAKAAK